MDKVSISRIEIKDYRLCKHTVFTPNPFLSVLIGPNGSGKTTILRALLLLKLFVTEHPRRRRRMHEKKAENIIPNTVLKVYLKVGEKKLIHTIELQIDTDEKNNDVIINSEQKWYAKDFTNSGKILKFPISYIEGTPDSFEMYILRSSYELQFVRQSQQDLRELFDNKEFFRALQHVAAFYNKITYYSASKFTNPSLCPVSFEYNVDANNNRISAPPDRIGHQRWLLDLYENRLSEGFREYLRVVGPDGIKLIDDITFLEIPVSNIDYSVRLGGRYVKRSSEKKLVIPQIHIGSSTLSPSQLSEGTFKTLGMLFYIMTDSSSAILLEEPEVCIHHGLLSTVIELIKAYSDEKQMLVSTHSDFLLDFIEPESVFVVRRNLEEGIAVGSLKSSLGPGGKTALQNYLNQEGSLGEYWRMGALDD